MRWDIHADGSFDIITDAGALRNAVPGIDHQDIRAARVTVERARVRYELAHGSIEILFAEWEHGMRLACTLEGVTRAPRWIHPVHSARVEGFGQMFRQGMGFSGPSGLVELEHQSEPWMYESYMLAALVGVSERTMVIGPHSHRDFLYKVQVYNRHFRHNFRNREIDDNVTMFEAGMRTECIALDGKLALPELFVSEGNGVFDTLRGAAVSLAAANSVRAPQTPRYHYCSAYHYGPHFTTARLEHLLDGLARVDTKRRVQTVQIDDWYMTSRGDWLTFREHLFPGGLAAAFEKIKKAGYTPGIWVAPFMVGCDSELARNHPDWLLKKSDGTLVTNWRYFVGSMPDFEHYVLDTSNPEALAWVKTVFSTMRSWGVRFFKTDFMEWGYRDSTRYARHTPGKTGAQYFDDVMKTIREAIGDDSYWLGCITYFAPSVGYMDGMRMTSDVGPKWDREGGIGNDGVGGGVTNMIDESFATLYMNNVLWQNDPDVVFVRDWHIDQTETEFRSLAAWAALPGHSVNTSDEIGDLPPDRLAWWRWIRPSAKPWTARLPYFAAQCPFRVVVRDYPDANGQAVLVLNDKPAAATSVLRLAELTGQKSATVFRWSPGSAEALGVRESLLVELDAHASELFFLSRDGKAPPEGLNLGGSVGE